MNIKIVELPGLPPKGDVVDFRVSRTGQSSEAIRQEIENLTATAPAWTAPVLSVVGATNTHLDPVEAARAGTPYAMTDLGNAERLVAYHGAAIHWDVARKIWRAWDGRRWEADSALTINRLAADTARRIRQEASKAPAGDAHRDLGKDLFNWAVKSESRERLAAMVEVAKSCPGVAVGADMWDADPWVLNCENGTVDLRNGTLRQHNRRDMLTKLTRVEFHPARQDDRWQRYLHDATGGDTELIGFLQIVAGYTLTGLTVEEVLFLVYGPEASGKTTFLECLRTICGEYARVIQADLLTKSKHASGGAGNATPDIAGLAGARMVAASEMEQGREFAEALAKNVTGGETITARHLYAETFDFLPQFKLWLALNHCPKVSADDGAIWRRILRIGFEHTVPSGRRDKTLKPYLRSITGGAPAVLVWAVEGCLRWQREGLTIPEAVRCSTAAYRQESDPLATFCEDALRFTSQAWTPWGEIWTAYCAHAAEQGTGEKYRVSPKRLQEKLRSLGCTSDRRFSGRGWLGVEVLSDWQNTDHVAHDGYDASSKTFGSFFIAVGD